MKSFGIIAEFNPLHNGHNYIINTAKELGASHVTVCLSGNFVQRGDLAIISKFKRAEMAIKCGADLVVELPLPYSLATANRFAFGGINILQHFADNIIFGTEGASTKDFLKIIDIFNADEYKKNLNKYLNEGNSFALSRYNSIKQIDSVLAEVLNKPNNTLALEYILEAEKLNKSFNYYPILRKDVAHDSTKTTKNFCSASYIRDNILDAKNYMPKIAYEILKDEYDNGKITSIKNIENSIISYLKRLNSEDFLNYIDVSEGLNNRIKKAADDATNLDELYTLIKTKRYALSRIRRIVLSSYLDINKSLYNEPIPYIRVLAFNKKGEELIKIAIKNGINVISSLKNAENINSTAKKFAELEQNAGKLYGLAYNAKEDFNEYKYKVYKEN